jgi:hypothetical protein
VGDVAFIIIPYKALEYEVHEKKKRKSRNPFASFAHFRGIRVPIASDLLSDYSVFPFVDPHPSPVILGLKMKVIELTLAHQLRVSIGR